MLGQIVLAGASAGSFAKAAQLVKQLAGVPVSARHVNRLTALVGRELAQARDQDAAAYRRRELAPVVTTAPTAVVVELDGGRVQTRTADSGPGVQAPHWREDKVACLATLESVVHAVDPQPEVPACYLDPSYITQVVQQVHGGEAIRSEPATDALPRPEATVERPARGPRTVVATLQPSDAVGPLLAAAAHRRRFFAAARAAFVADGQAYNWTVQEGWFPHFTPITDWIHALTYVYAAAQAGHPTTAEQWSAYTRWLTACWQGNVATVLPELQACRDRLGPALPEAEGSTTAPRETLQRAWTYLTNNQQRMDYPRYRREGLPMVSAWVESLIKEINDRVKGTAKFWNDPAGAEAILQVRAAVLSDDDRLAQHLRSRPVSPYRRAA